MVGQKYVLSGAAVILLAALLRVDGQLVGDLETGELSEIPPSAEQLPGNDYGCERNLCWITCGQYGDPANKDGKRCYMKPYSGKKCSLRADTRLINSFCEGYKSHHYHLGKHF